MFSAFMDKLTFVGNKHPIEHNAAHGASLDEQEQADGGSRLGRVISWNEGTTRNVKSQGNLGPSGMDALRNKAIQQQERVAERSRLRNSGMLEPHKTHKQLVGYSNEHTEVANGRDLWTQYDTTERWGKPAEWRSRSDSSSSSS